MNSAQKAIAHLKQAGRAAPDFLDGVSAVFLRERLAAMNSDEATIRIAKLGQEFLVKPLPEDGADRTVVVECPVDGTKLRLPNGKAKMKGLCPKCHYSFLISTLTRKSPKRLSFFS